jgi:Cdc6-like AAA superfamily ATPase
MLDRIVERRAFASVTRPDELATYYVPSDQLAGLRGDARPEVQLMRPLAELRPPQRLIIVGSSGAGKTSLIRKVLSDLARRKLTHEVLVIDVGDDPARLESGAAFMRTVVQLIERQGHRFGNVDQTALSALAADETTRTGRQVEHRGSLGALGLGYTVALKDAFSALKLGDNPARAREDFRDIVRLISRDHRPVVVIDDTEHFVAQRDGEVQASSVHNLFHHAIRALAEVNEIDLVVAMHPLYRDVAAVKDVCDRFGFREVAAAELPADREESALGMILQKRLDRRDIDVSVPEVVDAIALTQLESVYFFNRHDLREVLDLADAAARIADQDGAARVKLRHVRTAFERARM